MTNIFVFYKNFITDNSIKLIFKIKKDFKPNGSFGWKCCYCGEIDMILGARRQCSGCQKEFDLCFQKNKIFPKSASNSCSKCNMVSLSKNEGRICPFCRS